MPTRAYYQAHRAELAEAERRRYHATRGRVAPAKTPRVSRPRTSLAPIPTLEVDHPIVAAAVCALRPYERHELGGDFDAIALDLVGAYCLAVVEGGDPDVAIGSARSRYAKDRAALVHGLALVDGLER